MKGDDNCYLLIKGISIANCVLQLYPPWPPFPPAFSKVQANSTLRLRATLNCLHKQGKHQQNWQYDIPMTRTQFVQYIHSYFY